jgi:hypothetical protein
MSKAPTVAAGSAAAASPDGLVVAASAGLAPPPPLDPQADTSSSPASAYFIPITA